MNKRIPAPKRWSAITVTERRNLLSITINELFRLDDATIDKLYGELIPADKDSTLPKEKKLKSLIIAALENAFYTTWT